MASAPRSERLSSGTPTPSDPRDLGFGSRLLERENARFLNRDGTFNVARLGLPWWKSLNLYHTLVSCSWWSFYGLLGLTYLCLNILFAFGYLACGPGALAGTTGTSPGERFSDAFFFSVQTLATIGYGAISPHGLAANVLVSVEALLGLLGVALATGLSFARFSRPQARLQFADRAVVAPYAGGSGFMFRLINERSSQLIEVHATVTFSRQMEDAAGRRSRRVFGRPLERDQVAFFPLHWTVVHPITTESPLYGLSAEDLIEGETEVFVLITAYDEASAQTVHTRTSYRADEIAFGVRYADIFVGSGSKARIDVSRLSELAPVRDAVPGERT
jgi:inward rectifier potassium channel